MAAAPARANDLAAFLPKASNFLPSFRMSFAAALEPLSPYSETIRAITAPVAMLCSPRI